MQHPRAAQTIFFDGGCPICRREITWYRKMRGAERIHWQDIAEGPVPDGMDRDALLRRFTVRRCDGAVVSGGPAFIAVWRSLGPTEWLGRLLDRAPFVWLAERGYRAFLRLRVLWRRPA